nr:MAG TPA: hypothetical protein [Phage sp. ctucZ11]
MSNGFSLLVYNISLIIYVVNSIFIDGQYFSLTFIYICALMRARR